MFFTARGRPLLPRSGKQARPNRMHELAAGSGRVTIPLAQLAARNGFNIVGLERSEAMLDAAEQKLGALSAFERRCVAFVQGDLREWPTSEPFDLILVPCSSLSHLLTLEDQVAAWTRAHDNLAVGGRFVVDLTMPSLGVYADSMQTPPRTLLEIDIDTRDPVTGARLLRYKTTQYLPHEQRASIRFVYDKFPDSTQVHRYVSDFDCHVYYPREVELLFLLTGFDVESRVGDYYGRPLRRTSRQMIVTGVRR